MSTLELARQYLGAGLSVIPVRPDGTKAPAVPSWREFQSRRATCAEATRMFGNGSGIAIIGGAVSGGLEVIDFDCVGVYSKWLRRLEEKSPSAAAIARELPHVSTPSGGDHVFFRAGGTNGNTKLAMSVEPFTDSTGKQKTVLIETRATGGYVLAPGCPPSCHEANKPYRHVGGAPLTAIPVLTSAQREALLTAARHFDEREPEQLDKSKPSATGNSGGKPGDEFNKRASWDTILAGWKRLRTRQDGVTEWRRSGKERGGLSATTGLGESGQDLLYVFSSNAAPFEPDQSFSKFAAYTLLNHGGDFKAAARDLGKRGYGNQGHGNDEPPPPTDDDVPPWADEVPHENEASEDDSGNGAWPDRQPLPSRVAIPDLPVELLPSVLRQWLRSAAQDMCAPLCALAAAALIAAGAVIGRSVGVRPYPPSQFCVVPNLWGGVCAPPGMMKTNIVQEGCYPVRRLAAEAHKAHIAALEQTAEEMAGIEAEIKAAEQETRKRNITLSARVEAQKALTEARRRRELLIPPERRYVTQDATVEALGILLEQQPRGVLVERDELAGWLHGFEKTGREGDRAFYLEAWNGTGSFRLDRVGRKQLVISALTVSLVGSIQPGKLSRWTGEACEGGDGADGLLQRLQLLVHVDKLPPWKAPAGVDTGERNRAFAAYKWLDCLDEHLGELGACLPADDPDGIPWIGLGDDAQRVMNEWRAELEQLLRTEGLAHSPAYASHVAKYRSLAPSLALIGHLLDVGAGAAPGPVSEDATRRALALVEYFDLHARHTYGVPQRSEATPHVGEAARQLAKKLQVGAVGDGEKLRDIARREWSGLKHPETVKRAAADLERLGWVRLDRQQSGPRGGRPTDVLRLHPDIRGRI